ncbi:A disintegrin and metalloproteinase with thrombospondin motifs 18-like [Pecten maximus]|uniref:A disintegrin and metalloproteinase with thrombospondin motifs 18-like n=1 Tax=Pecten maximus TaxID=6579 RepID=UPI0014588764|nr:A disintegrin and metalloproteinase with thrombospondin motifs 18-like [Pecten maximus]
MVVYPRWWVQAVTGDTCEAKEYSDIVNGKEDDIDKNKKEDFSSDNVKSDDAIHHDVTFNDVTLDGATLDDVADAIPDLISKHHLVKRSVTNHELEFLVVTDYSVYKYWYDVSTASTSSAKAIEAKESIRQYYAYVINEIDMKYSDLQSSVISIDVVLADIVIADTVASSPWTEDTVVDGKVDAATVLVNFTTWHQTATNLPGHDHAMLFSKYDFTAVIGGTVSGGVAGLAFRPGICKTNNVAVCEDKFNFNMMTTAAHELGHNLGSPHDGIYNLSLCNSSFGYIMAPVTLTMTEDDASNPWIFSSCSVTSFEDQIATLNSQGNNCLLTLSKPLDPTALTPYDQEIPGQLTPPDEQCARLEGNGSFLCRRFYEKDYSTMCYAMYCQDLESNLCFNYVPATGTTCGDHKWCVRGVCVYNSTAPASLGCQFGDRSSTCDVTKCDTYSSTRLANCCETCYVAPTTTTTTPTTTTTTPTTTTTTPTITTTTPTTTTTTPTTTTSTATTTTTTPTTTTTTPTITTTTPTTTTTTPTTTTTLQPTTTTTKPTHDN